MGSPRLDDFDPGHMHVADLAVAGHDLPPVAILGVGVEGFALIHLGHHLAGRRFLAPNDREYIRVVDDGNSTM